MAATHKALEQAVAAREFREGLFDRLNLARIHIPPLRERRDDIPLLVNYFLKKYAQTQGHPPKSIAAAAGETLQRFHWPGNVPELENMIQRAILMAKSDVLLPGDLPALISSASASASERPAASLAPAAPGETKPADMATLCRLLFQWARENPKLKVLPAVEPRLIIQALLETKGNQVRAAKLLGITRATLRKLAEKFHIKQELAIQ
jgi:DNA-binding NtrC family response regulator